MTPSRQLSQTADGNQNRVLAGVVLVMLVGSALSLLLAPGLMPDSYDWIAHTTSESAAQGINGAWLARLGFVLFGSAVLLLSWVARARWGTWGRLAHAGFGALMVAAGVFAARPWDEALPYDATEDLIHSVVAFAMGVAFAVGVLAVMVRRPFERIGRRLFDWLAIASAPLIPLAMTVWPEHSGLLQRLMFALAFVWYGVEAAESIQAPVDSGGNERDPG